MKNKVTSTNRWSLGPLGSTRASNVGSYCFRFRDLFFLAAQGCCSRPSCPGRSKEGDILVVDQQGGQITSVP